MGTPTRCAPALRCAAVISALVLANCMPFVSRLRAADPLDSLALVYDDGMGGTLPYRLFLPPGYDDPGAEFPLVLFLHGAGERGDNNTAQVTSHINGLIDATQSERFASFLLAPQAPAGGTWSNFGPGDALASSTQIVTQVIALLESQYQIDPSRRYITGLSMGGFGTFDVIAKRPDMFAAAAPMSGGGDPSRAADMVDTPLWVFHGRNDSTVNVEKSREMVDAIVAAGGDPLYTETDGPHAIWGPIYEDAIGDFYPWMFEGVIPPVATLIYNANTGKVRLDATDAPDGAIDWFRIRTLTRIEVDGDVIVNGVPLEMIGVRELIYDGTTSGGFSSIVDLGNIMPAGLTTSQFTRNVSVGVYTSPSGGNQRQFQLQYIVPEPDTAILLICGLTLGVPRRRCPTR